MAHCPSEKTIRAAFGHDLDSRILTSFRKRAKFGNWQNALHLADKLIAGYGGEAIRCPHRGLLAVYVNTGDTYSATLLYNVASDSWRVTTWGDYIESFERRYGRKAVERLSA